MGGRGAGSGAKRSSSGASAAAKTTKPDEGTKPIDNSSASTPQSKVDTDAVRKYGFENAAQIEQYAKQFYTSGEIPAHKGRKAFTIEEAPYLGKDTAVIRVGSNPSETANFLNRLKTSLNVSVSQWGMESWYVDYKRNADYTKKAKVPKQKKK